MNWEAVIAQLKKEAVDHPEQAIIFSGLARALEYGVMVEEMARGKVVLYRADGSGRFLPVGPGPGSGSGAITE